MKFIVIAQPDPQEVVVDVSVGEFIDELMHLNNPNTKRDATDILNTCLTAIKSIPDNLIIELNEEQRKIVAKVMEEQMKRYQTCKQDSNHQSKLGQT